jgi:hypothetical protein
MSETLTIELPETLYRQLQRFSELVQQSPDVVVAQSLQHSLLPLLEEIPPAYQPDVYPLLRMSAAELQDEVRQVFPEAHWAEYEALLMKKKSQAGLTPEEQQRLKVLRREADVLSFRKSYAAVLLRRRGYEVPTPSALPQL